MEQRGMRNLKVNLTRYRQVRTISSILSLIAISFTRSMEVENMNFGIGMVLYDPKVNRFLRIRERGGGQPYGWICSDYCNYYEDTQTAIFSIPYREEHLNKMVDASSPADHPDFCKFDGIGWSVREDKKDILAKLLAFRPWYIPKLLWLALVKIVIRSWLRLK
jgi:hypothetical protein